MFCTIKSRNDMKAVETMEIKVFIVSKSTYDQLFINEMASINFAT